MCNCLRIGRDLVVLLVAEVDPPALQRLDYFFHCLHLRRGASVLDQDLPQTPVSWSCGMIPSEHTKAWPTGDTLGPCKECKDMMETSWGRCLSNASLSGALTDVCPATIAPSFVAAK